MPNTSECETCVKVWYAASFNQAKEPLHGLLKISNILDATWTVINEWSPQKQDLTGIIKQFPHFQDVLRESCLHTIARHDVLPPSLPILSGVTHNPKDSMKGGYGLLFVEDWGKEEVVVKIPNDLRDDVNNRKKRAWKRECIFADYLSHPFILKPLGICHYPRNIQRHNEHVKIFVEGLVTPYMKNRGLDNYVQENKTLDVAMVNKIIYQFALAIEYLHDQGVVHGDISLNNVFIHENGDVRLADFGLSLIAKGTSGAAMSSRSGQEDYIAPELGGKSSKIRRTAESDIFAFALTCARIYQQKFKCDGFDGKQVTLKLRDTNHHMPPEIFAILQDCANSNPEDRPSAKAVVQSLRRAIASDVASRGQETVDRVNAQIDSFFIQSSRAPSLSPRRRTMSLPPLKRGLSNFLSTKQETGSNRPFWRREPKTSLKEERVRSRHAEVCIPGLDRKAYEALHFAAVQAYAKLPASMHFSRDEDTIGSDIVEDALRLRTLLREIRQTSGVPKTGIHLVSAWMNNLAETLIEGSYPVERGDIFCFLPGWFWGSFMGGDGHEHDLYFVAYSLMGRRAWDDAEFFGQGMSPLFEGLRDVEIHLVRALSIMMSVDQVLNAEAVSQQDRSTETGDMAQRNTGDVQKEDTTKPPRDDDDEHPHVQKKLLNAATTKALAILLILFAKEVQEGLDTLERFIRGSSSRFDSDNPALYAFGCMLSEARNLIEDKQAWKRKDVLKYMVWYGMMEVQDAKQTSEAAEKEVSAA